MNDLDRALWEKTCVVISFAVGEIEVDEFEKAYSNFYWEYPLHGNEGDESVGFLSDLQTRSWLVAIHRRVQEEVLSVTSRAGVTIDNRKDSPAANVRRILAEQCIGRSLAEFVLLK